MTAGALNLFPARVPIGHVPGANGRPVPVLISPEFARALADLLVRVGGPVAMGNDELAIDALFAEMLPASPAPVEDSPLSALAAQLGEMQKRVEQLEQELERTTRTAATAGEMQKRVEQLEQELERVAAPVAAATAELVKTAGAWAVEQAFGPPPVRAAVATDWTKPGAIGSATPNSGAFTTLSTTSNATLGSTTATNSVLVRGANAGVNGGAALLVHLGGTTSIIGIGNRSALIGGAYDATPYLYHNGTLLTSGDVAAGGSLRATTGFGCNGAVASGKVTVAGSRGGNAALQSLLTALATFGLIADSTTA